MSEEKLMTALGVAMSMALIIKYKQKQNKTEKKTKKKRIWSMQKQKDLTYLAKNELRLEDPKSFKNFFKLSKESFDNLLSLVGPLIAKQNTNLRESTSINTRLLLTLRFLATANTYQELSDGFGVSNSLISMLIPEVLDAIYKVLSRKYLKAPTTAAEWKSIANDFYEKWNFPMCMGAIDGKHVAFRPRKKDGTHNYNYKGFNSTILIAVVDANFNFIMVDVGVNGKANSMAAFNESGIGNAIKENSLDFPEDEELPETNLKVPYVFISDDDFRLPQRILKPYSQSQTEETQTFNYRFSTACRVVKNAFDILASRFQIFQSEISLSVEKVELITLACCALHNYLNMVGQEEESSGEIKNWTSLQKEQVQDNYADEVSETVDLNFQEYPPLNEQDLPIGVLVVSLIMIIITGLMILGIFKERHLYMSPWIIIFIIAIIGQVIYYINDVVRHYSLMLLLCLLFIIGVQILILSPIIILFDNIRCKYIEQKVESQSNHQQEVTPN